MKTIQQSSIVALLLLCFTFSMQAQERITNFAVELHMDTTNVMTVQESISIISEGIVFKRGIIRSIPNGRADASGKVFYNPIKVVAVTQDGAEATYQDNAKSGELEIRIGDADVYLKSGAHTYVITYEIENQVGFFETYDEIYWNVTGDEWGVPIDNASCLVHLPAGASSLQSACYTGYTGSQEQQCTIETQSGKPFFTTSGILPNQGFTISTGFTKGIIQPPPPPTLFERYAVLGIAAIFMLGILVYMSKTWLKYGKDPQKPTVIPQFTVPRNLSPVAIGFYDKKMMLPELFSVGIISLATKGYITITEETTKSLFIFKDTNYTITKIKEVAKDSLPKEEAAIMNNLFSGTTKTIVADGQYKSEFLTAKNEFSKKFDAETKAMSSEKNRKFLWIPLAMVLAFWAVISFYNLVSVFMSAIVIGFLLILPFFLSIGLFVFASIFKKDAKFDKIYRVLLIIGTFLCISIVLLDTTSFTFNTKVVLIFSFMALIIFFAYQYLIKRPTEASLQLASEIDGFKMYMKSAEEKQLQMFHPPAMTPALFEQLMPYAIALGVEKLWGDQFQKAVAKGMISQSYSPTWYHGNQWSSHNFSSITNNFASTVSQSSSRPSSGSSGGGGWSGGSSGGGSSGGGGGGGGGGGW